MLLQFPALEWINFCLSGSDNNIAEEDIGAEAENGEDSNNNNNNNNNVPRGINRLSREYPQT